LVTIVRRDAIFYQLFQRYPQLIFELVDLPIEDRRGEHPHCVAETFAP
jgi:predicted transposase YdaD